MPQSPSPSANDDSRNSGQAATPQPLAPASGREAALEDALEAGLSPTRLRVRFTKCGDLRWISHRDLARVWERLLRRAGWQLAFSQGFHPKPKISFLSALAVGIEALDEVVEMEIVGPVELPLMEQGLRAQLPPGMELLELRVLDRRAGKARLLGASYRIAHNLPPAAEAQSTAEVHPATADLVNVEQLQQRIAALGSAPRLELIRDGKAIGCDTTGPHFELRVEGPNFLFSLPHEAQGSIRPSELLECVGLGHLLAQGELLQRTAVHLQEPAAPPPTS